MSSELEALVKKLKYRPGWKFQLQVVRGELMLGVTTLGYDSYHPKRGYTYQTHHYLEIPPTHHNWQRWLLDQCMLVDIHEALEFFMIEDDRPYAPLHSRAANAYYDLPPP
jgi:hypothetical protein